MGQEQLVEQLDISKPAVSRALDSLETKGFVIRQQNPSDRRAHIIHLTVKARKIAPDVKHAYNQIYALALQGISQEEFSEFVKLFDHIAENFAHGNSKNNDESTAKTFYRRECRAKNVHSLDQFGAYFAESAKISAFSARSAVRCPFCSKINYETSMA
jgi:predicted transcriptional regulator